MKMRRMLPERQYLILAKERDDHRTLDQESYGVLKSGA
jgi:hypothetical protein